MVEAKQVKVDNWGIFFLQRLQQFYNKTLFCDLTLQFEDNVQLKVHRLVLNACTEYFQMLESTCSVVKDCLVMPSDLPSDVVIPIINFMYSGILEFQESLFDRLYAAAKLMNMFVLTKLLDAQKNPIQPVKPAVKKVQSVTPITWNLQGKKITTKPPPIETDLPETLPGRKLPIWKRKSAPLTHPYIPTGLGYEVLNNKPFIKSNLDEIPKPTRFEWPDEDAPFDSSFDEISYTSKPIILPTLPREGPSKPGTSNSTFDEIKRSGPVKRSSSPIGNQCKKVNIQDVKEYLKEHKIRSDYIDYDDSETTDNDLQTYEVDDHDSNEENSKDGADIFQQTDDIPNKGILKTEKSESSPNKHVRFSLDGKENAGKSSTIKIQTNTSPTQDVSNHTKIITEVLKKYPHLVKKNKNIRLKILAKGANAAGSGKPLVVPNVTAAKSPSKVQYMVMKPEAAKPPPPPPVEKPKQVDPEQGPWTCSKCNPPTDFSTYHGYRQHLTRVHNEKTDSQMCDICGHISRKQNMLVYHKYTRHNIPPPVMYNFPKCKECSHIALSPLLLNRHVQHHRDTEKAGEPRRVTPWSCKYCDESFFSENTLLTHQQRSHEVEIKEEDTKPTIPKEKIKILSDIKMNPSLPTGTTLIPVRQLGGLRKEATTSNVPLEPSSEAEALSNVASGIAASLGLVDTIVVLDENQFILQPTQGNLPQNVSQDYIIPDMQIPELNIATTSIETQNPIVTLTSEANSVLSQSLNKSEITSTDELVMVLTDHDYGDATNQAVISADNNIVVLYSHPVQTQAAMMINSETGMLEVDKNYHDAAVIEQPTEESIEMIQQEINNHLETDLVQQSQQNELQEYPQEAIDQEETTYRVCSESVAQILQENQTIINENQGAMMEDEPMEVVENEPIPQEMIAETEHKNISIAGPQMDNQELSDVPHETLSDMYENECHEENSERQDIQEPIDIAESEPMDVDSVEHIPEEKLDEIVQEQPTEIETEYGAVQESIEANLNDVSERISEIGVEPDLESVPEQILAPIEKSVMESVEEPVLESVEEPIEKPVVESDEPVMKTEEPIVKEPVIEMEEPIIETEESVIETEETIMETEETIIETEEQIMEPEETCVHTEELVMEPLLESVVEPVADSVTEPEDTELVTESVTESNIESTDFLPDKEDTNIIAENSKILENTEELLEDTQKLLEVSDNTILHEVEEGKNEERTDISEGTLMPDESVENQNAPEPEETEIDNIENPQSPDPEEENIVEAIKSEVKKEIIKKAELKKITAISSVQAKEKISKILDDWDDADTDSPQSNPKTNNGSSINKLIDDWEEDEDT